MGREGLGECPVMDSGRVGASTLMPAVLLHSWAHPGADRAPHKVPGGAEEAELT